MKDETATVRDWLNRMPFQDNPKQSIPPEAQITITWEEWVAEGKEIADVERLLSDLLQTEKDALTRSRTAMALGILGSQQTVKVLLNSLAFDIPLVQMEAACALGRLGNAEAVEPLCKALQSQDSNVRANASVALAKIGGQRARDCLAIALQDPDSFVRAAAKEALDAGA